ncbi:MAG TPA: hypothetical protein VMV29_04165 [Ktedonobacterales bacterium]|nr:hypothetical protein [Ktedonobacterales bacterium]
MNPYTIALFAHVSGAIGVFVGVGVWLFGALGWRQAQRVEQARLIARLITTAGNLVVGSLLVLIIAGLYMALTTWGLAVPWLDVATGSFLLLAPLGVFLIDRRVKAITMQTRAEPDGPLSATLITRLSDPVIEIGLRLYLATLLGIVFLMTTKPPLIDSLFAIAAALAVGVAASLPVFVRRPRADIK